MQKSWAALFLLFARRPTQGLCRVVVKAETIQSRSDASSPKAYSNLARGVTLVELLVVLVIIAMISGLVTFAVLKSMQNQEIKQCQTNMLMIEAAKDEYVRDHPGGRSIEESEFKNYFRFGIPKCPSGQIYVNMYDPNIEVICPKHGTIRAGK
jgi:prepilin-type N-terminal cleavage/methylation domain-containing protein